MTEAVPTNIWKEINATWNGVDGYLAENEAGARILTGQSTDNSPTLGPMEMLLVALAGCTAIDVIDILKKKQQMPLDFKIKVRGNQRTDVYPKAFTEFQIEYFLWGDSLQKTDVEHAIRLSEQKYCSVGGTLSKAGPILSSYRILKPGEKIE